MLSSSFQFSYLILHFNLTSNRQSKVSRSYTWTMMTSNKSLQPAPTMKDIPLSTVSKGELVITNSCLPASTNLNI